MSSLLRIFGIAVAFGATTIAWAILGGLTASRTSSSQYKLDGEVNELWGREHRQTAPTLGFNWQTPREVVRSEVVDSKTKTIREMVFDSHSKDVTADATEIDVGIRLDQRLKGLMWYSLYDVDFEGTWTYVHTEATPGDLTIGFQFPDPGGVYDGFHFVVAGKDRAAVLKPENGKMSYTLGVEPGDEVEINIGYKSRGMDRWVYQPATGVSSLKSFRLTMSTDFDRIDFPAETMSPSEKSKTSEGWKLDWRFAQVVTGHGIGVVMPGQIQPGDLAAALSFSAPISLLFFFLILFVLSTMRGLDIHPVNYLFLGGAFFAFHLLFSYSVDHLSVVPAFILSSVVSVLLVVSYLRLVVSARFAFVEAALAQLVYLVGFSLAHFWEGYTGLTVTILSIITLFVLMQLTGRLKWTEVLRPNGASKPVSSTP